MAVRRIKYRMLAVLCGMSCLSVFALAGSGRAPGAALTSAVKPFKGLPALYVNGKLTSSLLCYDEMDPQDCIKAGFPILALTLPYEGVEKAVYWKGPGKYNFDRIDEEIDTYLKLDPTVLLLPKIDPVPGSWWCREFPNEISLQSDGTPTDASEKQPCHFSFASQKYQSLAREALKALVAHFENKYGNNILGYHLENGLLGEWYAWDGWQSGDHFGVEDYSTPAKAAFQQWLRIKYEGKQEELQRSWGDPAVTFESAAVPSEHSRMHAAHGIFFDPGISSHVPDYFEFLNDMVATVLLDQAHVIKEVTQGRKIVGAFFGYLWSTSPSLTMNHGGHLGFEKVLDSPDIDFIASPYVYDHRYVGGADTAQSLPAAVTLHHKLYFNEADTITHLAKRREALPAISPRMFALPRDIRETEGLLVRDYGYALTGGFGMWYYAGMTGLFSDPEIIRLFSELRAIDQNNLQADKQSVADVAVVLDEDSFRYFSDFEPLFMPLLAVQKQWELVFMGAPFDDVRLNDLVTNTARDYKFYIFVNTFRVTAGQRALLQARFKRNHATALWVYAPGYIDKGLSVENMSALTGIRLAESDSSGELRVQISSQDHPYTNSLPAGLAYGTDVNVEKIRLSYNSFGYLKGGLKVSPRFWGDDPTAIVLGHLMGIERPGLLVKEQPGWTSVYSSAPIVPAALLRRIASAAGCHIYSDADDVVYANKSFLVIYAPAAGARTIRLPRPARVIDLLQNRTLSTGVNEFTLNMSANEAKLLELK